MNVKTITVNPWIVTGFLVFLLGSCIPVFGNSGGIQALDEAVVGKASPDNPFFTHILKSPVTYGRWRKAGSNLYIGPNQSIIQFNPASTGVTVIGKAVTNPGLAQTVLDENGQAVYAKEPWYDAGNQVTGTVEVVDTAYDQNSALVAYTKYFYDSAGEVVRIERLKDGVVTVEILQALTEEIQESSDDEIVKLDRNLIPYLKLRRLLAMHPRLFASVQDYLSDEQIKTLPAWLLAYLSSKNFSRLTPEKIFRLSAEDFKLLRPEQLKALNARQVAMIPGHVLEKLPWKLIQALDGTLSTEQVQVLRADQTRGLSPHNLVKLTSTQFLAMEAEHFNDWNKKQLAVLNSRQVREIPREVLVDIHGRKVVDLAEKLSGEQLRLLIPEQIVYLDPAGLIKNLKPEQFEKITVEQIDSLTEEQLVNITVEQVDRIPAQVLEMMAEKKIAFFKGI